MKMFLNCGCCEQNVLPYNIGWFPAHQTLLGDSTPPTGSTLPSSFPVRSILWYRYRTLGASAAEDITVMNSKVFGVNRDQWLDAIWLGCRYPWPEVSEVASWSSPTDLRTHIGGTTNTDLVSFYAKNTYWPVDTDPEFDVIETHLQAGRDLVIYVPPLSWYAGAYSADTWDGEVPEAATALASLNTFLLAIGSNTTAFGIRDSDVIDKVPRLPANGVVDLNWPGANLVHGVSYEMSGINIQTASDPPGTSTIQSDFDRGVVRPLPWHSRTYFRHSDATTYLEPMDFVQCRFDDSQSYDSGTITEYTQLGKKVYRVTADSEPAESEHYAIYGAGTYTAATAIRERLAGGGTLYLIPANSQQRYGRRTDQFWINLVGQSLSSGLRHARYCYAGSGTIGPNLAPGALSGATERGDHKATGFGTADSYVAFYDDAIATRKRIYVTSPVDLQAGTTTPGDSSDGRYTQDAWTACINDIRWQTPDQGANPEATIAGPHRFILSDSDVRSTDQHQMTLQQVGTTDQYTTQQKTTYSQLASFIAAGMVSDAPGVYGDYAATPAFAGASDHQTRLLQEQKIVGVFLQWGVDGYLEKWVGGTRELQEIIVPMPGFFHEGKIYLPTRQAKQTNWRAPFANSTAYVSSERHLSQYYPLSAFVNIADTSDMLDLSQNRFFVKLMAYVVDALDWGVNGAANTYYRFTTIPSFTRSSGRYRTDFAYRPTSGASLQGLEITITAELDTTFAAGETITYSLTITNSSENTLDVTAAATAIGYTGSFPSMAAAAVEIDTHVYTITEADVTAGLKLATITATAEVPTGSYRAEGSVTVVAA